MKKKLLSICIVLITITSFAQPVYQDVAGIFINRCTSCHHENQHAPSFLTYSQVLADTANMYINLSTGYMPPWSPDTTYSRFTHERLISVTEKNAILAWISAGALPGDTSLAPTPPAYPQYQLYGTPDAVIQIPTFTSNAGINDSYVCFSLPMGLATNRIVRAYEIVAGNATIVHHVIINVDTLGTSTSDLSGACYTASGNFALAGWAPGAAPTVFPSTGPLKSGITIKAGSKLVVQMHYPAGTIGQQDSTKIRIYYYPIGTTGVRPMYVTTPLQNWMLNIPANTVASFEAKYPSGAATLPFSISMFGAFPHSHNLATYMVNNAYLGVDTIPLIKINKWDFNWQGFYTFKNIIKVPTGYKLYGKHIYDNTISNPNNPSSPPVNVIAGVTTSDEMLFDSFMWMVYYPGDELIDLEALLSADPLLSGINETSLVANNAFRTFAYPNPFENKVNIAYTLQENADVKIEVYSIYGNLIRTLDVMNQNEGLNEIVWDGKNNLGGRVVNGSYIYVIKAGNKKSHGKLTLISGK